MICCIALHRGFVDHLVPVVVCCVCIVQIIALRFSDGSGFVSIPEFLEFFTTPATMRMAKAATAAVRMSLDLLQLTADEEYLQAQGDEDERDSDLGEISDEDVEMAAKVRLPWPLRFVVYNRSLIFCPVVVWSYPCRR